MTTYECAFRCINSIIFLNNTLLSLLLLINSKFLKYNCLNVLLYVCVWLIIFLCVKSVTKVDFPLSLFITFGYQPALHLILLLITPYHLGSPLPSKCTSDITYSFKLKSIPLFDFIEITVTNHQMHSTPTTTIKQYDP